MDLSLSLFGSCSETHNIVSLFANIEHKKRLPPEPQTGNVEYKLKLINPSKNRLEHLITQLNWRLHEGRGKAIYEIGVEDNGVLKGLSEEEMSNSLDTLEIMAMKLGAKTQIIKEYILDSGKKIAEVLITMSLREINL
ncbi:GTP-binding protein 2-like [Onthophagus taurus]|uniref:GTP-binding protein 2-like n=1 Tax=Onthophagus taurus TaxID=166361 RepID=UPI0039BDFB5E